VPSGRSEATKYILRGAWVVQGTVGAITVTAQATSSPDRHDTQGSGDFYLATNGDI
jgi:hypothetical protein